MMNRVWKIGLATLSGFFVACTGENGIEGAGSSMETENSIALSVQLADGTPAAHIKVFVRPDSYLASGDTLSDSLATANMNFETDASGSLELRNLGYGSYIVEARGDSLKGASTFNYRSWHTDGGRVSLHVGPPGAVAGQVVLEEGTDEPVTVAVQGLDYSTETDSDGNFEFESLPAGNFEMVAFVQDDSTVVNEKGKKQRVNFIRKLGSVLAEVRSGQFREVQIDARPPILSFVLDDFEKGVDNWKIDHSEYATGKVEVAEAGLGREGKVAHFTCTNDSLYQWVLMGYELGGFVDMSGLDSIVFWARANAVTDSTKRRYISFSFDMNLDSTSEEESGKAWTHIDIDTVWNRYVVIPSELQEPDSNKTGGNLGWDVVNRRITDISIFGGTGGEFWIDDIEVFGYSEFVAKKQGK